MGGLRLSIVLISVACVSGYADPPKWPVEGIAFHRGAPFEEFVQATASGRPESALFGCVRNGGSRFHEAIDIAPEQPRRKGEATDPVYSIEDGFVAHINRTAGNSSYGRYVVIEHFGMTPAVYSLYAHLAAIPKDLAIGKKVALGDRIGTMGRSAGGYAIPKSRAHLHLEVGLRLSSDFQDWYDRQGYTSRNHHGNFNGMNLTGWDPLDYFEAFRDERITSTLSYIEQIPPAAMVHIRTMRYPDFLERYPSLKLEGCAEEERAGWEVVLSGWGLPLSMRPISASQLKGAERTGEISVVAVNPAAIEAYDCRSIVTEKNGSWFLGSGGRHVFELLFKPD